MAKHTDRLGYSKMARCYFNEYMQSKVLYPNESIFLKEFVYTRCNKEVAHRFAKMVKRKEIKRWDV